MGAIGIGTNSTSGLVGLIEDVIVDVVMLAGRSRCSITCQDCPSWRQPPATVWPS